MNYQEEIIVIISTITQEPVLRFLYSLIRTIAVDPEGEEIIKNLVQLLGAE